MRHAVCLLMFAALAPALWAQPGMSVEVEPVVEGKATPGSEYTMKLRFTVPEGYHAYHKDNPGYSLPVKITWSELSGLELLKAEWPEPHKHVDEFSEEWELDGTFDIAYTFKVPDNAKGSLSLRGSHEIQFCDAAGCFQSEGDFSTSIEVEAGAEVESTPTTEPKGPQAKATATFASTAKPGGQATLEWTFELTKSYHVYHPENPGYGTAPEFTWTELSGLKLIDQKWPKAHEHEIDTDWIEWEYPDKVTIQFIFEVPADASGELKLAADWSAQVCDENACFMRDGKVEAMLTVASVPPTTANDATNEHGFYLDFDYALQKAKEENKPLLVDFNGKNCIPCRKMERSVFVLPEVHELMETYVIVSVQNDIGDERYNELWAKYKPADVSGVPYYMVLDHDGKAVRGIASTLPASERSHEFVSFLKGEEVTEKPVNSALTNPKDSDKVSKDWPKGLLPGTYPRIEKGFDFEAKFSTEKIKPGTEVTLELRFKTKENDSGYPYHLHHPSTPSEFAIPLEIISVGKEGLVADGDWQFPGYEEHDEDMFDGTFDRNHYMIGDVVIARVFKVPSELAPGKYRVWGHVKGQFCDNAGCIDFIAEDASASNRMFGWVATIEVSPEGSDSAVVTVDQTNRTVDGENSPEQSGLFWFLLAAFGAGIITLLTPCVLPVLPLTIGFFVSQSSKGKSPLLTAFIYCTCIVATFTLFGLITSLALGATGAQNIATNGYVNAFLAIMFLVFALSFLGMFELRVPNFMTQWFTKKQMGAQQEGHGYAKAFFSGSAFSLISFSCTGPIAGTFLAQAATGSVWVPTLAMMAFASGMALPIFIMGQFPGLMKKMPKSGGWMNAMKVVFGFIEIGLAIMYLSAAEQAFTSVEAAEIVSRYVVLAVWASASVAIALYLFGVFRMPHDHEETKQIGVLRSVIAVSFFAFALYMLPGLFGAKYGNVLEGILPPPPRNGGIQLSMSGGTKANDHHDLPWHKDFDEGMAEAKALNKPVFLDFTGYN
ncbi:MAG: protein-disulfide reductase DsbD family protein [Planctomycetota bacterium]